MCVYLEMHHILWILVRSRNFILFAYGRSDSSSAAFFFFDLSTDLFSTKMKFGPLASSPTKKKSNFVINQIVYLTIQRTVKLNYLNDQMTFSDCTLRCQLNCLPLWPMQSYHSVPLLCLLLFLQSMLLRLFL